MMRGYGVCRCPFVPEVSKQTWAVVDRGPTVSATRALPTSASTSRVR
jgi:hypothetical protein